MGLQCGKIAEEFEEKERKEIWIQLTVSLGFSALAASLLDLFFQGVPLGFIMPLVNEPASMSRIIYYVSFIVVGSYI
ncbi:MAG: hypothetical protein QXY51_03710, partial [Candidatus Bathyarchaeia archaeon]